MNLEKIESRRIVEIRAGQGEDRTISGTAIVFNTESKVIGRWDPFTEIIKPEAVTPELLLNSDILMLFNHEDGDIPMARSKNGKGSLKVTLTATGVDFSFDARKTPQGDEILAAVRSGDVDSCSFAFCVADNGDSYFFKEDGGILRTITAFECICDFSLVNNPAYAEATVRSLDKAKEVREEKPKGETKPEKTAAELAAEKETNDAKEQAEKDIKDFYAPLEASISLLEKGPGQTDSTLPADVKASYDAIEEDIANLEAE